MILRYNPTRRHMLVVLGLTILFAIALPVLSTRAADPISQKKPQEIVIELAIPGMPQHNCTDPANIDPKTNKAKTCVADFTEYVTWFYRFFAGAVGMLAAVMILYGGYQWLTAGGNAGHVQQAKTTIYSSLIAIVLTLGTYLILHTINPQLTNLSVRGVTPVTALHDLCSQYPSNIKVADANGCDPRKNANCCSGDGCCGSTVSVSKPDNTVQTTCIADDCVETDKVCNYTEKQCQNPREYCKSQGENSCYQANSAIRRMFAKNGVDTDTMMCGKWLVEGGDDKCVYDKSFTKLTREDWDASATNGGAVGAEFRGHVDDFLLQPIDCFTPGAEDVCWKWKDSSKKTKKDTMECPSRTQRYCNDFNNRERPPMAGVDAGCLQKKPDKWTNDPDKKKQNYTCIGVYSASSQ